MLNLDKLFESTKTDNILHNFVQLKHLDGFFRQYAIQPTNELSEKILNELRSYFLYVSTLSYVKKSLHFKYIHLSQNEYNRTIKIN